MRSNSTACSVSIRKRSALLAVLAAEWNSLTYGPQTNLVLTGEVN